MTREKETQFASAHRNAAELKSHFTVKQNSFDCLLNECSLNVHISFYELGLAVAVLKRNISRNGEFYEIRLVVAFNDGI